jgi:hypothetical protein
MRKTAWIVLALLGASCSSEPVTYTFTGTVVVINKCSMNFEHLPVKVKVAYTMPGEKGEVTAEQVIDVEPLDDLSMHGKFSIQLTAAGKPPGYKAAVSRPNGKNICLQLPCPSPFACNGGNIKEGKLDDRITYSDTLKVTCGCN